MKLLISRKQLVWVASICGAVFLICLVLLVTASVAPSNFPTERSIVTIKKNMYMSQAGEELKEQGVIKSVFLYKVFVTLLSGHRKVKAGDYVFEDPQSVVRVAIRTASGDYGLPKIKVTLFEGLTTKEMGTALKKAIPKFDLQTFLTLSKPLEGSLSPDTYYFYENTTPKEVIDLLRETHVQKMKTVLLSIQAFGKPVNDVLIMSSIVEKEALYPEDRRIIAGILWKRLQINMPLQVDAPFHFLYGKASHELTLSDLAVDSPYNTYKHTGLPPTPINNPGLNTIKDTINPIKTEYLFFLTGKDGKMRYAATFEEHIANKRKYL